MGAHVTPSLPFLGLTCTKSPLTLRNRTSMLPAEIVDQLPSSRLCFIRRLTWLS